ncbi:hypothetical protein AVEN_171967-1 [Araneus ventricosus]|uniref:Uncharacterized protein n=1 Tax=Araneus ventricosus TaxID=182803 RepID=A0A4Y2BG80_ARAVE|nr:hypothetical protein AVEN_19497-1 [Araneus ventricosus]GBL91227.1 hypothetical protein AVEN_22240-1 [Araneus ventricosus]GBL91267.1 hypothetical protein AVEN_146359-1 [Araneus ventricosus]GBL91274.1 hypothetical protein AVEN_171967-1 [Araneus ventricosus]
MTRMTDELTPSLHTSAPHQREDVCPPTYDLAYSRPAYTAGLYGNWVSNPEPFGPETKASTLGHRCPDRDVGTNVCLSNVLCPKKKPKV